MQIRKKGSQKKNISGKDFLNQLTRCLDVGWTGNFKGSRHRLKGLCERVSRLDKNCRRRSSEIGRPSIVYRRSDVMDFLNRIGPPTRFPLGLAVKSTKCKSIHLVQQFV